MKILLINQAFYPDTVATSRHLTDIAVYLAGEGHEVSVYASQHNYNQPGRKYASFENYRGVRIYRLPVTGLGKRNAFTRVVDAILFQVGLIGRLLFGGRPDVVVSLTTPPLLGFVVSIYGLLFQVRCVQYVMDMHPHTAVEMGYLKRGAWFTQLLYKVFSFSMRHSERVIVLDRWMGERVGEAGVAKNRISVVPLWPTVNIKQSRETRLENGFRKAHGLGDKFVLLYSGNHGMAHPLDTILDAAVELKDDPNFVFVFVGGGERVRDVKEAIEKHKLRNVLQLPFQPEELLQQSLTAADVHLVVMGDRVAGLVHPSKIYGVLAVGKPYIFVGPQKSPICDLLLECEGGWHVSHGEVGRFISILKEVRLGSLESLSQMGEKNADYATQHFSPERVIRLFAEALSPVG